MEARAIHVPNRGGSVISNVSRIGQPLPPREDRGWVTTSELIDETSVTYRQVDYWLRTGLLATLEDIHPGTGWTRRLPADQIPRARAIHQLLHAGVSLQVIRQIIDDFVTTGRATSEGITFVLEQTGDPAA
nr:MerR family transcriptional regulator [Nocardioides sp. MAH-18]